MFTLLESVMAPLITQWGKTFESRGELKNETFNEISLFILGVLKYIESEKNLLECLFRKTEKKKTNVHRKTFSIR